MTQLATQATAEPAPEKPGSSNTSSLGELKEQLESLKVQASQLDKLKKAIDDSSKNVDEYKRPVKVGDERTVGEALMQEYDSLKEDIDSDLKVAEGRLDAPETVVSAIEETIRKVTSHEESIAEVEKKLIGSLDSEVRLNQRLVAKNQKAFEQLSIKSLKDRVAFARTYWQEANAVPATSEGYAEAYALLWLAQRAMSTTWLESDVNSELQDFTFPPDVATYETWLVQAYETMGESATSTAVAQKTLADAKATLDSKMKELVALRGSRKKDVVNAAKEAAKAVPATTGRKGQAYANSQTAGETRPVARA
jgi:hypothetical protein